MVKMEAAMRLEIGMMKMVMGLNKVMMVVMMVMADSMKVGVTKLVYMKVTVVVMIGMTMGIISVMI